MRSQLVVLALASDFSKKEAVILEVLKHLIRVVLQCNCLQLGHIGRSVRRYRALVPRRVVGVKIVELQSPLLAQFSPLFRGGYRHTPDGLIISGIVPVNECCPPCHMHYQYQFDLKNVMMGTYTSDSVSGFPLGSRPWRCQPWSAWLGQVEEQKSGWPQWLH